MAGIETVQERTVMPTDVRFNMVHAKRDIDYTTMDPEVVKLCKDINSLPGVITNGATSGKGTDKFRIWFQIDASPISWVNENACMQGLFFLTRCVDRRYFKFGDKVSISLSVGDTYKPRGLYPTMFMLEIDAVGDEAYAIAEALHNNMIYHLNHKNFKTLFSIDLSNFRVDEKSGNYVFNVNA